MLPLDADSPKLAMLQSLTVFVRDRNRRNRDDSCLVFIRLVLSTPCATSMSILGSNYVGGIGDIKARSFGTFGRYQAEKTSATRHGAELDQHDNLASNDVLADKAIVLLLC